MGDMPRIVLLMNPGAGYDRSLFRGIAQYARHYGPWNFLLLWERFGLPSALAEGMDVPPSRGGARSRQADKSAVRELKRLGVTGLIGRLLTPEIAEAVLALRIPTVALDLSDEQLADERFAGQVSHIYPDSCQAGRMAAEHLLQRGFRRFGFCGHPKNPNWSRQCADGFRQRLAEACLPCDVYRSPQTRSPLSWYAEQPSLVAWLESLQKPVGIMACNDVRGRHVIEAAAIGKIHVPNDIAVVGSDNDRVLSELSSPPLSSVAFNGEQGGYQAAALLDQMMSRVVKKPRPIVVEPLWVIARLSTDVVALEDREVADAVRYIRENARRPIRIADVVKHTGLSRRAMEIRFQRSLGWSIREEIQRVRLQLAKQLLAETDLPVWTIAKHAGFSSEEYMGKVFRRVAHTTPAQYRREHRSP